MNERISDRYGGNEIVVNIAKGIVSTDRGNPVLNGRYP